jgi:hypothetical protein
VEKELCVLRTKIQFSKYLMIGHQISTQNENRWDLLMSSTNRIDKDGLININKVSKVLKIEQYYKYTRILVDVNV